MLLNGQPLEISGLTASADVFRRSASQAAQGRTFTPDEDLQGNDAVILLSHELWQSRLAGRGDVVGSTIDADGRKRTVVGIMAPRVHHRRPARRLLHHLRLDDGAAARGAWAAASRMRWPGCATASR